MSYLKFDLTFKIGQYLDRHLVFPLLEFLAAKDTYDQSELLQAKLEMLSKTNMIDYVIDIRKMLYPDEDTPEEIKSRRGVVLSQLQELQDAVEPVLRLMQRDDVMKTVETQRDPKTLINHLTSNKEFEFKVEMIDSMYRLAKYRYECGNYVESASYLYFCQLVMSPTDKNYLSVLWGKLASEILVQNWDGALDDLNKLREFIDNGGASATAGNMQALQQRTWLVHWSLFVIFNHSKGLDLIIEMFLYKPLYLNAIQTMCPHILRYLATAVIINRSRRNALKDLVKVIQQEAYTYRDPITEFIEHLYVNFDFEAARRKLNQCQAVLLTDFFLIACLEEFVENARLMIFETFCRIHQVISIGMLAENLNMQPDEAECWIVNLIRNARLDAKIDSKLGHVVMGAQPLSPYQQLVERIDSLAVRSEALTSLVERKQKARNQDFNSMPCNIVRNLTAIALIHHNLCSKYVISSFIARTKNKELFKQRSYNNHSSIYGALRHYKTMLLIDIYLITFIQEFIESLHMAYFQTLCSIRLVLAVGILNEKYRLSKSDLDNEALLWYLHYL